MRRHRHKPIHHGLIGVLVAAVLAGAVYLSYQAVGGLPWQSHYVVYADVPDATRLVHHDEVRIGGVRVGQVASVTAMPGAGSGKPFARLVLSLNKSVGRLPTDTRVQIRIASLLGESYVDLQPGHSSRAIPPGGGLNESHYVPTVQLQDLLNVFNGATQQAVQRVITGMGYGFAGRGQDFNAATASFSQLLPPTQEVMNAIASPPAGLARYLNGFEATARALAPIGSDFAGLFGNAGTTFAAMNASGSGLGQSIDAFPPAESATTQALTQLSPALTRLAVASRQMLAGARLLPSTLPAVDAALSTGAATLRGTPAFAGQLRSSLQDLDGLSRDRSTDGAVRKFIDLSNGAQSVLSSLTPAQLQCNVFGLYGRNVDDSGSAAGTEWTGMETLALDANGAQNESFQHSTPSPNMHINPAPVENYQRCETGNEPYSGNVLAMGNPSGPVYNRVPRTYPPADALAHTPPGTP